MKNHLLGIAFKQVSGWLAMSGADDPGPIKTLQDVYSACPMGTLDVIEAAIRDGYNLDDIIAEADRAIRAAVQAGREREEFGHE